VNEHHHQERGGERMTGKVGGDLDPVKMCKKNVASDQIDNVIIKML
jgi:hypothetical protein